MQRLTTLAGAACILFGTAAANATPVNTATTATQTITFGPGLTDLNTTQSLNLFDSNLGTLTGVTLGATYGFNSNVTVTNGASSSSSGSVKTESAAGFSSSVAPINTVIANLIDSSGSVTVAGTTLNQAAFDVYGQAASYSLAPGASTSKTSNSHTVQNAPPTDSVAADLQAFQAAGGGAFDVLFQTATGTLLSNTGGNTGAIENTTATGTLSISYTYTPAAVSPPPSVPEPASLALFGSALLGLGMLRRINR